MRLLLSAGKRLYFNTFHLQKFTTGGVCMRSLAKSSLKGVSIQLPRCVSRPKQLNTDSNSYHVVYEGPLSTQVKYIKGLSVTTCIASLVGAPFLVMFGKESISMGGKLALAGTVALVGSTTTFILHWFTRVYIHRLLYDPKQSLFKAETMNIFARIKSLEFRPIDVTILEDGNNFSTFSVGNTKYFLHMELPEARQVLDFVRKECLAQDSLSNN